MKTSRLMTLGFWSLVLAGTAVVSTGCASGDGGDETSGDGDGDGDGDGVGGSTGDGDGDGAGGSSTAPPSVCDDAVSAPAAALVSDAETEDVNWDIYVSTPADGGTITLPTSGSADDPPEYVADGADDSAQSIGYAGTGWASYGAGINYNLEGCKDLTAYTGVRFWAKGWTKTTGEDQLPATAADNTVSFRVITAGAHAMIDVDGVNVGGDCEVSSGKCFMPPQISLTLPGDADAMDPGEWTLFEVEFDDLVTPAGANPGSAFTGTNAMLLGWHTEPGNFELYIDQVEFY